MATDQQAEVREQNQEKSDWPKVFTSGDSSSLGQMALQNGYPEGVRVFVTTRRGRVCILRWPEQ